MTGPVILDLKGLELEPEEHEILQHPMVAGIILFSRNYESPEQIKELIRKVRACRSTPLIVAVDHEGGRVQRFRQGFTHLPPMGQLGEKYDQDPKSALEMATQCGQIMASELFSVGVNLSLAPVLDLARDNKSAIGDRAFHHDPNVVVDLAKALIKGMREIGMASIGKHFPGHGRVTADSHVTMPIDTRSFTEIESEDLIPFKTLIEENYFDGILPAHIQFPAIDSKPVGFSSEWLKTILRKNLGFKGVIISDDLNMEGASIAGNYSNRALAALNAGCDIVLIGNNRAGAIQILEGLPSGQYLLKDETVKMLLGNSKIN